MLQRIFKELILRVFIKSNKDCTKTPKILTMAYNSNFKNLPIIGYLGDSLLM